MSRRGSPCANSEPAGPTTLAFTFSAALEPVHKVKIWWGFQWDGQDRLAARARKVKAAVSFTCALSDWPDGAVSHSC